MVDILNKDLIKNITIEVGDKIRILYYDREDIQRKRENMPATVPIIADTMVITNILDKSHFLVEKVRDEDYSETNKLLQNMDSLVFKRKYRVRR